MSKSHRVRFAPSPTGFLHLGGLRSALFDYLYAKRTGGIFVLRIEDTDRERLLPESVKQIEDSLRWLGLNWDEGVDAGGEHGPYVQSERLKIYSNKAQELVASGKAYLDYTSREQLEALREAAKQEGTAFRFTKAKATLKPIKKDAQPVIRFEITEGEDVTWQDAVWGEQSWKREVLDDFVMIKADGYPTYNFAVVVDDHEMEITQVFRGSEFLSTTPKNLLVYQAFGWQPPQFVHLPPVLGKDKAKLSKRHGAKSALEYRDEGYLPEAVVNYLASLGFNDGTTTEIYTVDELSKVFDLNRIQSSPAVFDAERLEWMNGMYLRALSIEELYGRSEGFWPKSADAADSEYKKQVLSLVQERLKRLDELPELTEFFFSDPKINHSLMPKQFNSSERQILLEQVVDILEKSDFMIDDLEKRLRGFVEQENLKTGQLFSLIRVAVTGSTAAPGLFETLHTLGKVTTLRRLQTAL
jgi:glutamyl-tRNA synthetase